MKSLTLACERFMYNLSIIKTSINTSNVLQGVRIPNSYSKNEICIRLKSSDAFSFAFRALANTTAAKLKLVLQEAISRACSAINLNRSDTPNRSVQDRSVLSLNPSACCSPF